MKPAYEKDKRQLWDEITLMYYWSNYIEKECSTGCNILVGKCEGKRRIGRHTRKLEVRIEIDIRENKFCWRFVFSCWESVPLYLFQIQFSCIVLSVCSLCRKTDDIRSLNSTLFLVLWGAVVL